MASRAPRIAWEAVYLPFIETILYGLGASGNGQLRLDDGRVLPMARFCSWLITCPIMLFQVVGIHDFKIYRVSCKHMIMAAALIRTVFGIGASVSKGEDMRWVQFALSYCFFMFEMYCAYLIFAEGLRKFSVVKSTVNNIVYSRIMMMRFIFFVTWNAFGIIWLLSSTGLCMISEDASVCKSPFRATMVLPAV
jgi:bacteriorhodopsin